MAGPHATLSEGFLAGEAITQYEMVVLGAAETITMADTQGEKIIGVAQEDCSAAHAADGRIVRVDITGITRVIAGGNITAFANVTAGADGRAETAASGDTVVGIAIQSAVDGDHMDILLTPSGTVLA